MRQVVLVAHDIRSAHNIGSLMRTAEGLGITTMYITGYSPYPALPEDPRLPHIAGKVSARIGKTSLGAENHLDWECRADIIRLINELKRRSFKVAALEQVTGSIELGKYRPPARIGLIVGSETIGLTDELLAQCDLSLEIPMAGHKESFNVSVAAGIALYHLVSAAEGS